MTRAASLTAVLTAATALAACAPGAGCDTTITDRLASPDAAHEVRVWRRSCESAPADTFHFELVEAGAPERSLARREQVFMAGRGAREDYVLRWRAPGALSVDLNVSRDLVARARPDLEVGDRTVVISYTGRGAT